MTKEILLEIIKNKGNCYEVDRAMCTTTCTICSERYYKNMHVKTNRSMPQFKCATALKLLKELCKTDAILIQEVVEILL